MAVIVCVVPGISGPLSVTNPPEDDLDPSIGGALVDGALRLGRACGSASVVARRDGDSPPTAPRAGEDHHHGEQGPE